MVYEEEEKREFAKKTGWSANLAEIAKGSRQADPLAALAVCSTKTLLGSTCGVQIGSVSFIKLLGLKEGRFLGDHLRKALTIMLACAINATPTTIYTSTDVPKGITGSSLTSTLSVPDSFLITDVNVSVNIGAFESSEHVISLTSPGGTTVQMFNRNCEGGFAIIMTFDDEAGSNLGACNSTNSNNGSSFQPNSPLSGFDGEDSQGTWTLTVAISNNTFANRTALGAWSIALEPAVSAAVPEPATYALAGTALAGLALVGYRRRRRQ